jgi:hypothetical protein
MGAAVVTHVHPALERLDHAAHFDAHCIRQCVRSYRDPTQQFADNGLAIAPIPASPGPGLSVRTEPAGPRIAWAPAIVGPKLSILFCNLRN